MLKVFLDHSSVSSLNLGLTRSRWLTGPGISASQSAGIMSGPSYPPHPFGACWRSGIWFSGL